MYVITKNKNNEYELTDGKDILMVGNANLILKELKAYLDEEDYYDDPMAHELELSGIDELDFIEE